VFVDDIVVHGADEEEFLRNLRAVLERLRAAGLRLKRSKCRIALPEVDYLGHLVNGDGIALSEARRSAVRDIPPPRDRAALRAFLGLANFFRAFVPRYAETAKPLTSLCSEKVRYEWTERAQAAFDQLKAAVVGAPMLHHLDYSLPIVLRTDASLAGVGGVLLQRVDGQERPVCFVSKAFTPTEARWATIEQEAYAVFYCVQALSHHLRGHHFFVETDHKNLQYLDRATSPKLIRWRLRLQDYDFTVVHIPGKQNVVADALSRCFALTAEHAAMVARVHNEVLGHRGVRRSVEMLREAGVAWDSMEADVAEYVAACPTCQKVRLGQGGAAAALSTTMVAEPFEVVAVDTVGPLPADDQGNRYVIVAVDCFSRYAELFPARTCTAEDAARALLQVFARYGAPRAVRSDQGPQFAAQVVDALLQRVGAGREFTIPYRPQANGIVERLNGEVLRHLRAVVMDRRVTSNWSEALPFVQRLVNSTPHSALGTTPSRVLFGDMLQLDRGILLPFRDQRGPVVVEDYIQRLNDVQRAVAEAGRAHQERVVDARLRKSPEAPVAFEVGDYVLASYPARAPSKLAPRWRGPLVVVEVTGANTYVCQDLCAHKRVQLHATRLKAYDASMTEDPAAVAAADNDEWLVEAIIDHRGPRNGRPKRALEFRVRWQGFGANADTWLPYAEVAELEALDDYAARHPELRL
jgi:transposase InsO family protein